MQLHAATALANGCESEQQLVFFIETVRPQPPCQRDALRSPPTL
jgi:hypothetical protein